MSNEWEVEYGIMGIKEETKIGGLNEEGYLRAGKVNVYGEEQLTLQVF